MRASRAGKGLQRQEVETCCCTNKWPAGRPASPALGGCNLQYTTGLHEARCLLFLLFAVAAALLPLVFAAAAALVIAAYVAGQPVAAACRELRHSLRSARSDWPVWTAQTATDSR